MDTFKSIVFGLFLIGLGGLIVFDVMDRDFSLGDSVIQTNKRYGTITSQKIRDYGVIDVVIREIVPGLIGLFLILGGSMIIKDSNNP